MLNEGVNKWYLTCKERSAREEKLFFEDTITKEVWNVRRTANLRELKEEEDQLSRAPFSLE